LLAKQFERIAKEWRDISEQLSYRFLHLVVALFRVAM
jgi:hypothetical protein